MRSSSFIWRSGREVLRLDITRLGGNLDHYYHFILDLVWPLWHWMDTTGRRGSEAHLLALEPRDLHFAPGFEALLGMPLRPAGEAAGETTGTVALHGFNTKSGDHWRTFRDAGAFRTSRERFVQDVAARIGLMPATTPAVVMIRRKEEPDDRGAARRSIADQDVLSHTVQLHARSRGLGYRDVQLEDLSMREQVALFHAGPVVLIGQHGAGLVNGLWMTDPRSAVIELAGVDNPPHFTNLFGDLGMHYERLLCAGEGDHMAGQRITVDAGALCALIDRVQA